MRKQHDFTLCYVDVFHREAAHGAELMDDK